MKRLICCRAATLGAAAVGLLILAGCGNGQMSQMLEPTKPHMDREVETAPPIPKVETPTDTTPTSQTRSTNERPASAPVR